MICGEACELIGADPEATSAELLSHLATCPDCQAYREQMLALNTKLKRALELDWRKVQPTAPPGAPPVAVLTSGVATRTAAEHGVAPAPVPPKADTAKAAVPLTVAPASPTPASAGRPANLTATSSTPRAPRPPSLGRAAVQPPTGQPPGGAQPAARQPAAIAPPAAPQPASSQPSAAQPPGPPPPERSTVTSFRRKAPAAVGKHPRPKVFALAASVAAALVVALTLWLSRPPETLADEVATHVRGEPGSWYRTQPVPAGQLDAVLRKSGVRLGQGMQPIVYASSCWFRGHFVPHFVVATPDGPVTVMILLNEPVHAVQKFAEEGYSGLLVPARTGSVAVLSRTPMPLEKPASDAVQALQSAN